MTFYINSHETKIRIDAWFDNSDSCYYLFLPSHANIDSIFFDSPNSSIQLNNKIIHADERIPGLIIGKQYPIIIRYQNIVKNSNFTILQSANISSMYLNTTDVILAQIYRDKKYKGQVDIHIISPENQITYWNGNSQALLGGRGNSTWYLSDKKPYRITLEHPAPLLSMNSSSDWILLANSFDKSNIRNKIVFDFAKKVESHWTPQCEYVDLYLNNSYQGLYLLIEKIRLSDQKLNLPDAPQFLFTMTEKEFVDSTSNPIIFITKRNQYIELEDARYYSEADFNSLQSELQRLEDIVVSSSIDSNIQLSSVIDIQSWANKYLMDEIFQNVDSWIHSNYFYCSGNGPAMFYSGPIWDYDQTMGQSYYNINSEFFITLDYNKPRDTNNTPNYLTLMSNKEFINTVKNTYQYRYLPLLDSLLEHGLDSIESNIHHANRMNLQRWHSMYEKGEPSLWTIPSEASNESVKTALKKHIAFLNSQWLEGDSYQQVSIESPDGHGFLKYKLRKGQSIKQYLNIQSIECSDTTSWLDSISNKIYHVNSIVDSSASLHLVNNIGIDDTINSSNDHKRNIPKKAILILGLFFLFMGSIIITDYFLNWRKTHV